MAPRISIIALPIGNTGDLSPRARDHLQQADLIFCEDTRKIKELSRRAGLSLQARFVALPGDKEKKYNWNQSELQRYSQWALVSDAGTPLINDPGRSLIEWARTHNLDVQALPGPCAPIAAVQWGGGFGLPLTFAGFPPKNSAKALENFFSSLNFCKTFCFFCSRHQFEKVFCWLVDQQEGARPCFIARDITKTHEELFSGSVHQCLVWFQDKLQKKLPLGEMTIVLQGQSSAPAPSGTVTLPELIRIRTSPPKQAAKLLAKHSGLSTKECYAALLDQS